MSKVEIKVFYAQGRVLHVKKTTFHEAMQFVWNSPAFNDYDPLKMIFTSTGKTLYMDKQAFLAYLRDDITQEELIEHTECDELFRNKKDVTLENGAIIDAGTLWKSLKNELTLIDDDNYIITKLDLTIFEIAD